MESGSVAQWQSVRLLIARSRVRCPPEPARGKDRKDIFPFFHVKRMERIVPTISQAPTAHEGRSACAYFRVLRKAVYYARFIV